MGADFIVPPGYPNDSYPMRVQSGEHVIVIPRGETQSNPAGNVYITVGEIRLERDKQTVGAFLRELGVSI